MVLVIQAGNFPIAQSLNKKKPGAIAPGLWETVKLWRQVRLRSERAQRAGHLGQHTNVGHSVCACRGARRNAAVGVQLNVRREGVLSDASRAQGTSTGGRIALLTGFQRPFINSGSDLAHVVDAGVLLRRRTSFHEVGNCDRGQQTNDGHNNHDFHQGETRFAGLFHSFHIIFLYLSSGGTSPQAGYYNYMFVHLIARGDRNCQS